MNKKEFVKHIAKENLMNKDEAEKIVDVFTKSLMSALGKDGDVTLIGFGSFISAKVKARTGRNPKTGEAIKIKAHNQPRFKAGIRLKEACNGKGAGDKGVGSK